MINRNELANIVLDHSQTIASKVNLVVGGTAAVSQTSIGSWLADTVDWFMTWPWMTTLSYVAIVLLIIERSFICWAHYRKYKRDKANKHIA